MRIYRPDEDEDQRSLPISATMRKTLPAKGVGLAAEASRRISNLFNRGQQQTNKVGKASTNSMGVSVRLRPIASQAFHQ